MKRRNATKANVNTLTEVGSARNNVKKKAPEKQECDSTEKSKVDQPIEADRALSESQRMLAAWMSESFGTSEKDAQSRQFNQICSTEPTGDALDYRNMNYFVDTLHGIAPRDQLEGLLAMQMVAAHTMAMELMRRAAFKGQTDLGVEVNVNRAAKLMRTFAALTEALHRYRGKGEQKMTVEHVHVHQGGQAIVGQVNQNNTQVNQKKSETSHG